MTVERAVSCGNCLLVLTTVDLTGDTVISDGVSTLMAFRCSRCGAEISVITRRKQVPMVDDEPYINYRPGLRRRASDGGGEAK